VTGLDLDAPLVVLNLRAVLNTQTTALGILMTCATAWLQAMIEAESDERSEKRIVVVDEAWRILSNLGIGEWLQQSFKLSRGLGAQNVVVMHRLSDLRSAGAEGSREVRLAEGLLGLRQPTSLERAHGLKREGGRAARRHRRRHEERRDSRNNDSLKVDCGGDQGEQHKDAKRIRASTSSAHIPFAAAKVHRAVGLPSVMAVHLTIRLFRPSSCKLWEGRAEGQP